MAKKKRHLLTGFLAAALVISTGCAAYAEDRPLSSGYGTGIFFDQGAQLAPLDFSVIKDGASVSSGIAGKSTARAEASKDMIGMSVSLEDGSSGIMAGAQAASRYEVTGLQKGLMAGLAFTVEGSVTATASGSFAVNFIVFDLRGNILGDISFAGERIKNPETGEIFRKDSFAGSFCPDPAAFTGSCSDPADPVVSKAIIFLGEGTRAVLPVFLPVAQGNGIIAELWGNADETIKAEFSSHIAPAGTIKPGVKIRFSTGQAFEGR